MNKEELIKFMTCLHGTVKPLFVEQVNGRFIVAAYQGSLSEYDILIKYRQVTKGKWSRIRTPKHIHWAVDVLIKMHFEEKKTKDFLDFLIGVWDKTGPLKNTQEREEMLSLESLLETSRNEINEYEKLGEKGEYSIRFLILLAKLLMLQEKTNLKTAYMFRNLLNSLRQGEDIFKIVSTATYVGR